MPTMTFSAVDSDLVDGPPPSWLHPEQDMLHHPHRHHQQQQGGDFLDTNNSVMQLLSTDNGWNANQRQQHDRSLQNQNQQQLDWQQQQQMQQQMQQQQQQPNWQGNNYYAENQQQQFEQNVQNMFGIGQTPSAETNMMYDKGSYNYDPYASTNNTQDVNTHAFLVALSFNAIIFLFLISSYEMFRKWFPSVYAPKIVRDGGGATGSVGGTPKSLSRTSSRLSLTKAGGDINTAPAVNINTRLPLGWIRGVAHASWSSVRSTGGLDSYMFLRYIRLCFRITCTSAIWGMIILWPVYATGDGGAQGWYV